MISDSQTFVFSWWQGRRNFCVTNIFRGTRKCARKQIAGNGQESFFFGILCVDQVLEIFFSCRVRVLCISKAHQLEELEALKKQCALITAESDRLTEKFEQATSRKNQLAERQVFSDLNLVTPSILFGTSERNAFAFFLLFNYYNFCNHESRFIQ